MQLIIRDLIYRSPHNSIYEAYTQYCNKYGADSTTNLLDVLNDHGNLIKNKL
jgi:hypothetical protein